jgi:hypothetical protein
MATGYWLDGRGSNRVGAREFFSRPSQRPTQPPIQWVQGALSAGVKRRGREADSSPPSSPDVKNDRAIPLLRDLSSWHGVQLIKRRGFFMFLPLHKERKPTSVSAAVDRLGCIARCRLPQRPAFYLIPLNRRVNISVRAGL